MTKESGTQARPARVTVGIPVRNAMPYFPEALESILNQTFRDIEIIISDNASTDETQDVARAYASRDPRIRYVRHPENVGAAGNYQRCVELANGEFFRWQAGDDSCAPTLIAQCVEILDRMPDVVQVHPRTVLIDGAGQEIRRYDDDMHVVEETAKERYFHVLRRMRLANSVYGLTRTDVLRKTRQHGSFLGADLVAQGEIALYGKIWEIPEYLFYRRMHEAAHSAVTKTAQQEFYTPNHTPKLTMYTWRHLVERMASVARAPIPQNQRFAIWGGLMRDAVRGREMFLAELSAAFRTLTSSKPKKVAR